MTNIIARPFYTEAIAPFIEKNMIKVLTGQRRVGKSYILRQIQAHITQTAPGCNVIYINKELDEFMFIRTHEDLSRYIAEHIKPETKNFLFIDEVQDIEGFEHTLRSLQAGEECDIFITGSNAKMLSGELATYLSGRYMEFHIHSLSYTEFLTFHNLSDTTESLRAYLTFGGLPYLCNLPLQRDVAFEYLKSVYSTIILKDVVKRENLRNIDFLETLALYTADNVGSLFSANNISRYLKSQRVNMSPLQVINYLKALQNAFLLYKIRRVDVNGLQVFEIGDKYFFEDLGLRNCHLGFSIQNDIGKLMENAIFLHLKQHKYEVFTGQNTSGKEVDFVARKDDEVVYIQSCYLMADEATRNREFGSLMTIKNNYPKYVVSMDEWSSGGNVNGIRHIHLGEFLKATSL